MDALLFLLVVALIGGVLFFVTRHPEVKSAAEQDAADLEARVKLARDQATAASGGVREWFKKLMGK